MAHRLSPHDVTPVLLAGGLGTRLRSVMDELPKVLAPVNGRPVLSYLLDQLAEAGFSEAILCTGYRGRDVRGAFGADHAGMQLVYSPESEPLGTAGALRHALPRISTSVILAMNGDSFINVDLRDFLRWFSDSGADAALVLKKVADTSRYGSVTVGSNDEVQCFQEKRADGGEAWVNAGVYALKSRVVAGIPPGLQVSLERDLLPGLAGAGLRGYKCAGEFIDIGTPDSYARADAFFANLSRFGACERVPHRGPREG